MAKVWSPAAFKENILRRRFLQRATRHGFHNQGFHHITHIGYWAEQYFDWRATVLLNLARQAVWCPHTNFFTKCAVPI